MAPSAARDLNRLPMKAASAALETIQNLAFGPRRMGKPLRLELEGLWSARRGPFRVIYSIDDESHVVSVVAVDHRADVYRRVRPSRPSRRRR